MRGDHRPRTKQTTAFASLIARAIPSWRVPSKNSVMMAFRGGLDRAESVATKKDVDRGEQSGKQRDRLASDPKTTNCQRLSLRNILSVQRESSSSALQYLIFFTSATYARHATPFLRPAEDCAGSLETANPRYPHPRRRMEIRVYLHEMQIAAATSVFALARVN